MGLAGAQTVRETEFDVVPSGSGRSRPNDSSLLGDDSLTVFQERWDRLQVEFVTEPGRAALDAEDLICDIGQALAASTVRRRIDLDSVSSGSVRFPEELWTTLQRCRLVMDAIQRPR